MTLNASTTTINTVDAPARPNIATGEEIYAVLSAFTWTPESCGQTLYWPKPLVSLIREYARSVFIIVGGYDKRLCKGVVRCWDSGSSGQDFMTIYWSEQSIKLLCPFNWRGLSLCAVACSGANDGAIINLSSGNTLLQNPTDSIQDSTQDLVNAVKDFNKDSSKNSTQDVKYVNDVNELTKAIDASQQNTIKNIKYKFTYTNQKEDSPVWASFACPKKIPHRICSFVWMKETETLLVGYESNKGFEAKAYVIPYHLPTRKFGSPFRGLGVGPTLGMCELSPGPPDIITSGSEWIAMASQNKIEFHHQTRYAGPTIVGREVKPESKLTSLTFWPQRNMIIDGRENAFSLWHRDTLEEVRTVKLGANLVCVLDQDKLAVSSSNKFHVIDLKEGTKQEFHAFWQDTKITGMCLLPKKPNWLVVTAMGFKDGHLSSIILDTKGSRSAHLVKIYDISTGSLVSFFPVPDDFVIYTLASIAL